MLILMLIVLGKMPRTARRAAYAAIAMSVAHQIVSYGARILATHWATPPRVAYRLAEWPSLRDMRCAEKTWKMDVARRL
jgi:hypothetical protein